MDPETVALATQVIGSLGFPICVALWLMLRTDRILREVVGLLKALEVYLNIQSKKE